MLGHFTKTKIIFKDFFAARFYLGVGGRMNNIFSFKDLNLQQELILVQILIESRSNAAYGVKVKRQDSVFSILAKKEVTKRDRTC